MKKTGIIALLTIFVALMIAGCGNSKQDPLAPVGGPYMFINGSSTDVNETNTDFEIFIQLLKDGAGYDGQDVTISPFDVEFGYVRPSTESTADGGWAIYTYHSPDNIDQLIGQSTTLSAIYDDGNGTIAFGSMTLNFVAPTPPAPDENGTCTTGTCPLAP